MKTLSKQQEDQIISGVKQAVELVADGLSPNAAIEKVARENRWGHELVKFASFAYNTGRQNAQLTESGSALEKFATFELADPRVVTEQIWPSKQAEVQLPANTEYTAPPAFIFAREQAAKAACVKTRVKAAQAATSCKTCHNEPCTCSKRASYSEVKAEYEQLRTKAAIARQQASLAYDNLLGSMGRLGDYFRKMAMDRLSFADVELAASTYYGAAGQRLMDWVYTRDHLKEARTNTPGVKFAGSACDVRVEPYRSLEECIKQAELVTLKRASETAAKTQLEQFVHATVIPATAPATKTATWSLLNGETVSTSYDKSNLNLWLEPEPLPVKQAAVAEPWSLIKIAEGGGLLSGAIGAGGVGMIEKAMGGPDSATDPVDKPWQQLEDPAHDAELRKIRTQAMLSDLMSNDDVIGGYDPEVVARTFNELSQLSPRGATQPAVMRAALRRHLQGNVQPFETRDVLDTEKSLKDSLLDTPGTRKLREAPSSLLG